MRPTRWTRAGAALAAQGRLLAYGLGELGARPRHAERFSIAYNIGRLPLRGSSCEFALLIAAGTHECVRGVVLVKLPNSPWKSACVVVEWGKGRLRCGALWSC